ncbi:hypothetical protein GJ744_007872 [Endocarpon pusillum]|uniref:Spc7 kinetochore protein domain-containing protein n=1 Tax=Endocarpon pusillum TaxID=364733 RepID=A0A8H7EBJ0_9EURO|nr:hypothetical protein GJ744_007872 [Endocarpon pusillum]
MDSSASRPPRPKSRQSIAHLSPSKDHEYDKENATADLGSIRKRKLAVSNADRKKSRSKSLGPGGLEALKESAGNTTKASPAPQIKSILKPPVPLTPPKAIPPFDEHRKRSIGRSARKSPKPNGTEQLLIDFSTPVSSRAVTTITGAENVQDPFSPTKIVPSPDGARTPLDPGEEPEAAKREKEAEELRKAQKQAILDQRAARRKSMANRRVSFAPEATLHTWNVIEMVEDSTTSSASNSTRRRSTMTAAQTSNKSEQILTPESDQNEPPSTPPEQVKQPLVKASPANQRDMHQKHNRRRSSGMSDTPSEAGNENLSSPGSTYSGSSAVGDSSPVHIEDSIHSSSDEDGDAAMSMDDATQETVRSVLSSSSTASSLDDRLRRAAAEAGTRGIEYDEKGDDLSMELAEGTITSAFQPWVHGVPQIQTEAGPVDAENPESSEELSMELADGTITAAFQPWVDGIAPIATRAGSQTIEDDENHDDLSMEIAEGTVTTAFQPWAHGAPKVQVNADTRTIKDDGSYGDVAMELAESTITTAFQPWAKFKPKAPVLDHSALQDQENINPFSPAFKKQVDTNRVDSSMEPVSIAVPHDNQEQEIEKALAVVEATNISVLPHNQEQGGGRRLSDEKPNFSSVPRPYQEDDKVDMSLAAEQKAVSVPWDDHKPQIVNTPPIVEPVTVPTPSDIHEEQAKEISVVVDSNDVSVLKDNQEQEVEKISLQKFLSMANIHFMELSTTKRRHTLAPGKPSQLPMDGSSTSAGACFAAAATTLPLLELYQHATRELKSYISTGRKVIGAIERDTMEEQPALFREYVDARPDVKIVMENQFRNGKANARLQSKEGWYAWRRQLVEGLRGGLYDIKSGMEEDAQLLTHQEAILDQTVPALVKHFAELEQEAGMLQQRAVDFESVDRESLNNARSQLESADCEVAHKMDLLSQLQQQMADKAEALTAADELKSEFQSQIAEAERVQDECRGWKAEDVRNLKEQVRRIEQGTGWTLVTAEHEVEEGGVDFGPALTLRYRHALRLFFYPVVFQRSLSEQSGRRRSRRSKSDSGPSAPISLTYAPVEVNTMTSTDLTTPQRFFLQFLQGQLHGLAVLPKGSVSSKTLLSLVSTGWDLAIKVTEEIRLLEKAGITNVAILSDEKLGAKCMLMLPDRCRIDVQFTLTLNTTNDSTLSSSVVVEATPRYGPVTGLLSGSKTSKVREALNKQARSKEVGDGAWVTAVRGLEDWVNLQKKETNEGPQNAKKAACKPTAKSEPASIPASTAPQMDAAPAAALVSKKGLKRPVPIEEVMEEAAARQDEVRRQEAEDVLRHQEELRRQEEEEMLLMSASKTPPRPGRRPGALRRSP